MLEWQKHPELAPFKEAVECHYQGVRNGNATEYEAVLTGLHELEFIPKERCLNSSAVTLSGEVDQDNLESLLRRLHPWRKGPWSIGGVEINTEWRSDWKWDRVSPHLGDLTGKRILDIGCGNGYHLFRMVGDGAKLAVGIEPYELFVTQFYAMQRFFNTPEAVVLPLGIEELPVGKLYFDMVFTMGVIYHRRDPIEHLQSVLSLLEPNGMAVVESITIPANFGDVLQPEGRYAKMRNVHHVPSSKRLKEWMEEAGFVEVKIVDEVVTSRLEQRSTNWMTFESLPNFLTEDGSKTVEGYPRPYRAVVIGKRKI